MTPPAPDRPDLADRRESREAALTPSQLAGDTTSRLLSYLSIAFGVYVALQTLLMVVLSQSPIPFADQWDDIISGRKITLSYLFSQHNEHRLLFSRLVFIVDHFISKENGAVSATISVILQLTLAATIYYNFIKNRLIISPFELWVAGFIFTCLFWSGQWENFTWGYQIVFFGVILAAAITFTLLTRGAGSMITPLLVIAVEFLATYTLASGIIVPFMTVALAV